MVGSITLNSNQSPGYPLVSIQQTMENQFLVGKLTMSMAMFNSYVN